MLTTSHICTYLYTFIYTHTIYSQSYTVTLIYVLQSCINKWVLTCISLAAILDFIFISPKTHVICAFLFQFMDEETGLLWNKWKLANGWALDPWLTHTLTTHISQGRSLLYLYSPTSTRWVVWSSEEGQGLLGLHWILQVSPHCTITAVIGEITQ